MRSSTRALSGLFGLLAASALATGCGTFTQTSSPETATHQLLLTTAADRAVLEFEPQAKSLLAGKVVRVDVSLLEAEKKAYVESALRNLVARVGATLAGPAPAEGADPAELIVEARAGTVAINQSQFGFGIPSLPIPIPQTSLNSVLPALNLFARDKQQGWAKIQIWVKDNASSNYVAQSKDLWGNAYQSYWTILFTGPWGFSEDVYPDMDVTEGI